MPSRKRGLDAELVPDAIASYVSTKCARTNKNHSADYDRMNIKNISNRYSHSIMVVWSQSMTEHQKNFLTRMLNRDKRKSTKLERVAGLIKPYIEREIPCSSEKTEKPMNLSIMRNRLAASRYSSVSDFVTNFGTMISNIISSNGGDDEASNAALALFRIFIERMMYCPVGSGRTTMMRCSDDQIKLFALQNTARVTDSTNEIVKPSPERSVVISIEESDESEMEDIVNHSDILSAELKDYSDVEVSDSPSSIQNEPLPTSKSRTAKMPKPHDFEEEARQLRKEIEERQQKLANMEEKQRVSAEIRDLDTEKVELVDKISATETQYAKLNADVRARQSEFQTHDSGYIILTLQENRHHETSKRLDRERERLNKEFEANRKFKEGLDLRFKTFRAERYRLNHERAQTMRERDRVGGEDAQLSERLDQLENQRAIAKKKLDELNNGNI